MEENERISVWEVINNGLKSRNFKIVLTGLKEVRDKVADIQLKIENLMIDRENALRELEDNYSFHTLYPDINKHINIWDNNWHSADKDSHVGYRIKDRSTSDFIARSESGRTTINREDSQHGKLRLSPNGAKPITNETYNKLRKKKIDKYDSRIIKLLEKRNEIEEDIDLDLLEEITSLREKKLRSLTKKEYKRVSELYRLYLRRKDEH